MILGNEKALARVRGIVRRAGHVHQGPVEGLLGPNGRPITRESYGNVLLVDAGAKAGTNDPIIPIEDRTVDGTPATGLTDLYAVRIGLDGFNGVSTVGGQIVQTWLPDFSWPAP